jgi:hypothetical protein
MSGCAELRKEMLISPIEVKSDGDAMDFYGARKIADGKAREVCEEPMLLAWFDRKTGEFSPRVE